jgi:cytochrome c oxidase subunit 1
MTPPPTIAERRPELVTTRVAKRRQPWIETATSADHKVVARMFIGSALSFLIVAVVEFMLVRLQLIAPDNTLIRPELFNRINSAAMTTFVILFALPLIVGLIGYVVPLQIGSRGIALPRLNQLGFWFFAFGAFAIYASFFYTVTEGGLQAAPPLSDRIYSPSHGIDAWIVGVALAITGLVCCSINMVATMRTMRAPGMAWRRAPLFTWAARVISYSLLFIGPVMVAALTMLFIDRNSGGVFFDSQQGGAPLLYQHLSWIFFTGVQAVLLIGAVGIISEIIPVFSRKPIFSHRAVAASMVAIAVLSFFAYMQNMYSAPIPKGLMFVAMGAAVGMLIPFGILLYVWISTMWEGANRMRAPMLWALLSVVALVLGLTGQLATAVIPVGWQLEHTTAAQQDTIVTLIGAAVLGGFAAIHYWMPKITGKFAGEGMAKASMVLIFIGLNLFAWMMFFAGL